MSENITNTTEQKPSERFKKIMDERHKLVDRIIENMKQGYIMPKPLWNTSQYQIHNPVSGAHYKGGNYIKLLITSQEKGYKDPRWLTYEHAQKMNWRVKKGAKGTHLEKLTSTFDKKEVNEETGEAEIVTVKLNRPIITHFTVFNAEQIEGIPPLSPKQENVNTDTLKLADQLIASSACPVMELSQPNAFYSPGNDRITLPPRNTFTSSEAFASVLMHEMIHSTGHESRLNRPILNKFGTPEYAKEELRAELGSYFMGTDVGIEGSEEILASHTQYLENWIKVLEKDPNELFRACNDAQKAVELLEGNLERQQVLEKALERAVENLLAEQEVEQQRKPVDINMKERAMPEAEAVNNADDKIQQALTSIHRLKEQIKADIAKLDDVDISEVNVVAAEEYKLFSFTDEQISDCLVSGDMYELEDAIIEYEEQKNDFTCLDTIRKIQEDMQQAGNAAGEEEAVSRQENVPLNTIEPNPLLDSINILKLDEDQHFHFTINTQSGEQLKGTYRLLADANGPENTIISLGDGHHPEVEAHRDEIRDRLAELTDFQDIKRLSQKQYQEDLTHAGGGATEIRYPEPVVQIIYSKMDHPMLKPGNQLTFAEANRLFGSLNTKRELEIYQSNHVTDPLYYQTDYKLLYQQNGIVNSIRDTYEIGGDEEDLLTHIMQSKKPIHEAYTYVSMHARLNQQQQEIELDVKNVKAQIENLRIQQASKPEYDTEHQKTLLNELNKSKEKMPELLKDKLIDKLQEEHYEPYQDVVDRDLENAKKDLHFQGERMQNVQDIQKALATGDELPAILTRAYTLEEYLIEKGAFIPYESSLVNIEMKKPRYDIPSPPTGFERTEAEYNRDYAEYQRKYAKEIREMERDNYKQTEQLRKELESDSAFMAKRRMVEEEFYERIRKGEIVEKIPEQKVEVNTGNNSDPQLDKDSIMQATEEYVEEQLQITEASVAMEA